MKRENFRKSKGTKIKALECSNSDIKTTSTKEELKSLVESTKSRNCIIPLKNPKLKKIQLNFKKNSAGKIENSKRLKVREYNRWNPNKI